MTKEEFIRILDQNTVEQIQNLIEMNQEVIDNFDQIDLSTELLSKEKWIEESQLDIERLRQKEFHSINFDTMYGNQPITLEAIDEYLSSLSRFDLEDPEFSVTQLKIILFLLERLGEK